MKSPRDKAESPLSLRRLTEAFSQMLGRGGPGDEAPVEPPAGDPCPLGPRSIIEAILFVGRPGQEPFAAAELAGLMRDVTVGEVDAAVAELSRGYVADGAPYEILASSAGYRLALREEFARLGSKLQGRVREAKLSPQALEVLAVVAYRQPLTAAAIDQLRKGRSGAILGQLVRRGLLRLDRPAAGASAAHYTTTDRFLRLFGLASLSQLPQAEEFDLALVSAPPEVEI